MRFFSPHSHCTFSYGDGHKTPREHALRLRELGYTGAALTDHGNISGHADWEKELTKLDLHPAFGCELYLSPVGERSKSHLIAIAETQEGYRNLCRLVSRSYSEGFYQYPTVHANMLADHAKGLIVTSGCADSLLSCTLLGGKWLGEPRLVCGPEDYERAAKVVRWFKKIFGDGYYLEVQRFPELERTRVLNPLVARLGDEYGIPLVATADVHHPLPEQSEMRKILHSVKRVSTVDAVSAEWEYGIPGAYPLSDAEIGTALVGTGLTREQAWMAILASEEIGQRAQVVLPKGEAVTYPGTAKELTW